MPVDGIPDAAVHCLCIRCRRWHEPQEGVRLRSTRAGGILGAVSSFGILVSGVASEAAKPRFLCHGCRRKRFRWRVVLFAIGVAAVVAAILLRR